MSLPLLSTAYWPPIEWFAIYLRQGGARIEASESLQKQSYRNRCRILGQHGIQELIIPLDRTGSKHITEIKLSDSEDWWRVHWKAIETAYSNAGFFAPLKEEVEMLYLGDRPHSLWEWNLRTIEMCRVWLDLKEPLEFEHIFKKEQNSDYRQSIHPKKPLILEPVPYYQGHSNRPNPSFQSGLSILDLIFNEGPAAYSILMGFS